MAKGVNNRRDVLLLLLYAPGATGEKNEPISGRTRLVKMLFLFKKEALKHFRAGTDLTEENFYRFFPWNFGPFSSQVYDDLAFFEMNDFIERSRSEEESIPEAVAEWEKWLDETNDGPDRISIYEEESFRLKGRGLVFAEKLFESLSGEQQKFLSTFKTQLSRMPLRGILRYVYKTYPDQTENSRIKDEVLGNVD